MFLYSRICKSLVYWYQPLRPLFGHSTLLTRAPSSLALVAVCSLCSQHQKLATRCVQAAPGALLAAFNELDHSCLLSREEPWLVISGTSWAPVKILQRIILMEGTVQSSQCRSCPVLLRHENSSPCHLQTGASKQCLLKLRWRWKQWGRENG